jgi:hypothetical protein
MDAVRDWIIEDEPKLLVSMQALQPWAERVGFDLSPCEPVDLPNTTWLGIRVTYLYIETAEEISSQLYYLVERASGDVYLAKFGKRFETPAIKERVGNVYGEPRGIVVTQG